MLKGATVRRLRKKRKWKPWQVAEKLGIGKKEYRKLEDQMWIPEFLEEDILKVLKKGE